MDLGELADDGTAAGEPAATADDAAIADTVDSLEAGSGVRVETICTNCNQASLTVNGVTGSDHVLVTFDGIPAAGGLGTVYTLTQYPGELVGYSHVARGPGSVLTGSGSMGGEIAFHSATRTRRRAFLDIRAGSFGTRQLKLAGGERWGPFGALVYLQGVIADAVDATGDDANEVAKFERSTYQGIFDVALTDRQTLTFGGLFYGENQWDGPGKPDPPVNDFLDEDAFFNMRQFTLSWTHEHPSGRTLSWRSSYSRRFLEQVAPQFRGLPDRNYLQVADTRKFSRFEARVPVGDGGMLTSGVGWSEVRLGVNNGDSVPPYIVDGLKHSEAMIQYDRSAGAHWDYGIGVRYDEFTVFGHTWNYQPGPSTPDPDIDSSFLLPRGQVHFRPTSKVVVGLSAGRFAVGPIPVYEKTCCGARYKRSRELQPERSWSSQLMVEMHPTVNMRLTSTVYWTEFKNYIQRTVHQSTLFTPEYANVNLPSATVRGIELVHDMRFRDNLINVGWTYGWSDPEDQDGEWLPYLPKHAASGYLRYDDVKRGTKVGFDVRWKGGLRHYRLSTNRGPTPPPGFMESESFWSADLSFEQRVGKKGWSVIAGVNNATDYVQGDLTLADTDSNGFRDQYERCYDWGPLTGRYYYAGAKFNL